MKFPSPRSTRAAIAAALFLCTVALFSRATSHEFVAFDDDDYVVKNEQVRAGLTWQGISWAFTTTHAANWHPLTWISHMVDVELSGMDAGRHHVGNVLLHALNALLLFLFLVRATGATWRSALVAALFAVHPLHVESVAWVSERKDVLCTFFGFAALWAYVRYAERPAPVRYAGVVLLFTLSLLSKPMWVTLPFLLLLLDHWPLRRAADPWLALPAAGPARPRFATGFLLLEKAPLLLLSLLSSVATFHAQSSGGAVASQHVSLGLRLGNAAISILAYAFQMVWPFDLAAFYPHPGDGLVAWQAVGAAVVVASLTAASFACWRRVPWVPVGWLWYLGTLVPVLGIVQVGAQARADRYTYVPLIGLFLILAWTAGALASRSAALRWVVGTASVAALAACAGLTWRQIGVWASTEQLFGHAIAVTGPNPRAEEALASYLVGRGRAAEALPLARSAVATRPQYAPAWNVLSIALFQAGRLGEAADAARRALSLEPGDADAWSNLGVALRAQGAGGEARDAFARAAALDPRDARRWVDLAAVDFDAGRLPDALRSAREAVRVAPREARWWFNLGVIAERAGSPTEAVEAYRKATALRPDYRSAWQNLGALLRSLGRAEEAAEAFRAAASGPPAR